MTLARTRCVTPRENSWPDELQSSDYDSIDSTKPTHHPINQALNMSYWQLVAGAGLFLLGIAAGHTLSAASTPTPLATTPQPVELPGPPPVAAAPALICERSPNQPMPAQACPAVLVCDTASPNVQAAVNAYRQLYERGDVLAIAAERAFEYAVGAGAVCRDPELQNAGFRALTSIVQSLAILGGDVQTVAELQVLIHSGFPQASADQLMQASERVDRSAIAKLSDWTNGLPSPDSLAYSFNVNRPPAAVPDLGARGVYRAGVAQWAGTAAAR